MTYHGLSKKQLAAFSAYALVVLVCAEVGAITASIGCWEAIIRPALFYSPFAPVYVSSLAYMLLGIGGSLLLIGFLLALLGGMLIARSPYTVEP